MGQLATSDATGSVAITLKAIEEPRSTYINIKETIGSEQCTDTKEELEAVFTFISTENFRSHPSFSENIRFYKEKCLLAPTIRENRILAIKAQPLVVKQSFIGIYFKKLPIEVLEQVFLETNGKWEWKMRG